MYVLRTLQSLRNLASFRVNKLIHTCIKSDLRFYHWRRPSSNLKFKVHPTLKMKLLKEIFLNSESLENHK